MRTRVLSIIALCILLSSCGGNSSGDSKPGPVPTAGVSGVAHDNILIGSTITIYSYKTGTQGAVLGTATTDQNGSYSAAITSESIPVLIVATGGYYKEEASSVQVNLGAGQSLKAVANFTTGSTITVQVTPFTHLAAGLASYYIKNGMAVSSAINAANQQVSDALGFDIIATKPLDITNPNNKNTYVTNELLYGFMSAAISDWTMFASRQNGQTADNGTLHTFYNSIAFAQAMYADIVADGVLDGQGRDSNNNIVPVSFGSVSLSVNVYRHALAGHLIYIATNTTVNQTGLTEALLSPFATKYSQFSTPGGIFGSAPPVSFANDGRPQVSLSSIPGCVSGVFALTATVTTSSTVLSGVLSIDSSPIGPAVAAVGNSIPFSINTDLYDVGSRAVSVTAMDSFGLSGSASGSIPVDRTPTCPAYSVLGLNGNWTNWCVIVCNSNSPFAGCNGVNLISPYGWTLLGSYAAGGAAGAYNY